MGKFIASNYEGPGVYEIRNLDNGRCYIGSSVNIKQRERQHISHLRRGKHHSAEMQEDYNAGHTFQLVVLKRIHVQYPKELQIAESKIILKRAKKDPKALYNSTWTEYAFDGYTAKDTIAQILADRFVREKTGMSFGVFFNCCPAEVEMKWRILCDPQHEEEYRKEYAEVIAYQNKKQFCYSRGVDYDEYLELPEDQRPNLNETPYWTRPGWEAYSERLSEYRRELEDKYQEAAKIFYINH